ncbi:MAG: ABC transporter permease subunit [Lachnospiraceae bacterium]|nr:ABC transporter permease subunit [Lachnospiraceae bacterium]
MKNSKVWLFIAAVCLLLGIAAIYVKNYSSDDSDVVEQTQILTGERNQSLAYDPENDIIYVGTHEGGLTAYQNEEILWEAPEAGGAYRKLVVSPGMDKLYAGNEGQHVYVYSTKDGSLLTDINVKRMLVGIAVNADESRIAVITNTGNSKSNLLVYSAEGEELYNTQYKSTTLRQIEYCEDGKTLLVANKKGEISLMAEDGSIIDKYKCGYDVVQMKRVQDKCLAIDLSGTYHVLDDALNCIRKGTPDNSIRADISAVGTDLEGKNIFVGSEQGYIFVMDEKDQQIYMADYEIGVHDTASADGVIYFVSLGEEVYTLSLDNILKIEAMKVFGGILNAAVYVFLAVGVICLVIGTEKLRKAVVKLVLRLWKDRMAYLFLAPLFIHLFFFSYRGIYIGLSRAFTNWSKDNYTLADMDFVGLQNFAAILKDGYFFIGIKNLLIILATNLLKILTVPILIAWLIYNIKGDKRKYLHRFLFVLPIVVPGVVNVMMWQRIYDPTIGLLNNLLESANLAHLQRVWLGDAKIALWAIIFVGFPFVGALPMLLYYGALGNIGEGITESALIDGGNKWQILWKIQLPLIKPQISLMVMLTFISSIQDYSTIYIMTGGGPGTSTYVPALELYLNVSQFGKYGYASAMGVVLLVFTLAILLIGNKISKKEEY